jgi:hypothetical protein
MKLQVLQMAEHFFTIYITFIKVTMTALKEIKSYKMQQPSHKQPHCKIVVRILTGRTEMKIKDVLGKDQFEFRG